MNMIDDELSSVEEKMNKLKELVEKITKERSYIEKEKDELHAAENFLADDIKEARTLMGEIKHSLRRIPSQIDKLMENIDEISKAI